MTRYVLIAALAVILAAVFAGCSAGGDDNNQTPSQECYSSIDCDPGYYCHMPDGVCMDAMADGDSVDDDVADADTADGDDEVGDSDEAVDTADGDDDPAEQDIPVENDVPVCNDDPKEDNDTRAQAATLPINATVAYLVSADTDYYMFQACADGLLTVTAVFSHAEGDINIALFNGDGASLARSETATDDESFSYVTTTEEILYVAVYNNTPNACTTYSLTITLTDCGQVDGDIDTPDTDPDPVDQVEIEPEIEETVVDLCDPDPCHGHGQCIAADGSCDCNQGFAGDTCNQCDDGYVGYPNCTPQVTVPSPGDIIITEIMYDPHFDLADDKAEWFELYNPGDMAMNLNDCIVSEDNGASTTVIGLIMAPRSYALFVRSADTSLNGGLTPDFVFDFALSNSTSGETLTLTCGGMIIDNVNYDSGPDFPDEPAHSISLDPSAYNAGANDNGANWCLGQTAYYTGDPSPDEDNFGTPGAVNPACPAR